MRKKKIAVNVPALQEELSWFGARDRGYWQGGNAEVVPEAPVRWYPSGVCDPEEQEFPG